MNTNTTANINMQHIAFCKRQLSSAVANTDMIRKWNKIWNHTKRLNQSVFSSYNVWIRGYGEGLRLFYFLCISEDPFAFLRVYSAYLARIFILSDRFFFQLSPEPASAYEERSPILCFFSVLFEKKINKIKNIHMEPIKIACQNFSFLCIRHWNILGILFV